MIVHVGLKDVGGPGLKELIRRPKEWPLSWSYIPHMSVVQGTSNGPQSNSGALRP